MQMTHMRNEYIDLCSGKIWIQKTRIQGQESITFRFDNDTVLDSEVMEAIRKHGAWHLYCGRRWSGADLSVFKPVAAIVKKLTLPAEKSTKIVGVDCLSKLESLSISGDLSELDFTKFTELRSLTVNEWCKAGNWHLCESLQDVLVDVAMANLEKLKALKNLKSLSCGRGLKSFEGIADLPALRELRVGNCHLATLESLGDLPNLRLLLLNLMPKLQSLKGIEGSLNLEDLDVSQCGGLRDVSAISMLKKLQNLQLAFCPHIKSLNGIKLPKDCKVDFVPGGKIADGF